MLGRIFQERLDELRGMTPAKRDKELLSGALEHGPLVMVAMLPIFALLLELVFLGTRRLYVEHLHPRVRVYDRARLWARHGVRPGVVLRLTTSSSRGHRIWTYDLSFCAVVFGVGNAQLW